MSSLSLDRRLRAAASTALAALAPALAAGLLVRQADAQQGPQQGPWGAARTGPARANIYRADAPPAGSGLPDPSLADAYGSRFNGQNLDGVGLFRINAPDGPGAYACTTQRIGPRTMLTAAHCVTDPLTGRRFSTANTARVGYVAPDGSFTYYHAANVRVQRSWLGFDNPANLAWRDVAVVNFAEALPNWITTYQVLDGGPLGSQTLTGRQAVIAGFGAFGGGTGQPGFDFYRRAGSNAVSGTADYAPYFGFGDYLIDFDDAGGHWQTTCVIENACDAPTTGATEAIGGPGDSGGPLFVGGRLAGIYSYGTYYCTPGTEATTCDPFVADTTTYPGFRSRRYDSFGALGAYAPVSPNLAFIRAATIPEPSTVCLVAVGVAGLAAAAARRRGKG